MSPTQLKLVEAQPTTTETVRRPPRDRYLDLLRFVAIAQVLYIHVVDVPWYPAMFPAMGIMFAIGASLLAGSLDRSRHQPAPVVKKRLMRLVAPVWPMAAVMVPLMLLLGWTNTDNGDPLEPIELLKWLVPVTQPPASDLGFDWALPLWFLSAYLWLVMLSPALLWLFRRWPKRMLAAPIALVVLNTMGLAPLTGDVGEVVLNVAKFGACWLLGFAHHDGMLERLRLWVVLALGAALYGLGIAGAFAYPPADGNPAPAETAIAYSLLSTGLVLVLLKLHPHVRGRFGRHRFLSAIVSAVNHRAMTIYLWGNACIALAWFLLETAATQSWWPDNLPEYGWTAMALVVTTLLLLVCAVCFGWVEDKAAGRPARLSLLPAKVKTEYQGRHRFAA